jgi:cysteine desulfurase
MNVVYLDNNATTRVADEVFDEIKPYFCDLYGNPSSMHFFGGQISKKITEAREKIADLIGARPDEIVFTSGGTESDNASIWGALKAYTDKHHIVTTKVEHPAVKIPCDYLKKNGYNVTYLPVDKKGRLNLNDLDEAIRPDTALVSIMWANNETGVIFPIEEAAQIAKMKGTLFHTDAVQAVGKIPINLKNNVVDLLSLSGHKLHGPKGIGVLYIRKGTRLSPFIMGGHQEKGRRGGTENVPSIIGLGRACEMANNFLADENTRVNALRDRLEQGLLNTIPNVYINGNRENRLPNTTSLSFEFIEGEAILLLLDESGICASSGSACTSGSLEPSHVLRAMGVPFTCAHGSIRFSLSRYTTDRDIDFVLEKMPDIIERLRSLSPFWHQYIKEQKASKQKAMA